VKKNIKEHSSENENISDESIQSQITNHQPQTEKCGRTQISYHVTHKKNGQRIFLISLKKKI
jgi:hypothetical protein